MKQYNIYKTTNLVNGKFYWGVHDSVDENDGYLGSGMLLRKAIKKYGKEHFRRVTKLLYDTVKEAYDDEAFIVDLKMIKRKDCYNKALGGDGGNLWGEKENHPMFGKHHSEEFKQKRSANMSDGRMKGENNPMHGKHHSEESRRKIQQKAKGNKSNSGKSFSDETKEKMRKSKIGNSNGFKKGQRSLNYGKTGKNSPNYGSKRSEEQKQNMRNAWIKRKLKKEK